MKTSQNLLVWLSKQNGFGLALLHSLVKLVNGTQGAPAREGCNKYDLTGQSYYDWSRWYAFSSLHLFAVSGVCVGIGVAKK